MSFSLTDTIAALASPPGPGARGVVRLSGDDARQMTERVFVPIDAQRWRASRIPERHRGFVRLGEPAVMLPVDAWLWPGTRSYTGQPSVEFHCVGSPPLLEALLTELFAEGARPAR